MEEVVSSDEEAKTESEEVEDRTLGESIESPFRHEDFMVFYYLDETKEVASNSQLARSLVSKNHEAAEVLEAMVIEKRLPNLLSLLESYAGTTTPKVPKVPRPPTLIPLPPLQIEPTKKKQKRRGRESLEAILNTDLVLQVGILPLY